jgi:hypothetical protein
MSELRVFTKEEVLNDFMDGIRSLVDYWSSEDYVKDRDQRYRLQGLAHSILTLIDGLSSDNPGFNLVVNVHPEDKEYNIKRGENYYENGMIINDETCMNDILFNNGRWTKSKKD